MRTSILSRLFILAGFGLAMISCSSDPSNPDAETDPEVGAETVLIDGYALDSAADDTKRFREFSKKYLDSTVVKSFTVRGVDLLQALDLGYLIPKGKKKREAFIDTTAIRVYMGIDSIPAAPGGKPQFKFKLFIVDVNKASFKNNQPGVDVFFTSEGKTKPHGPIVGSGDDTYVLDFNLPCPNTCETSSPLNQ